MPRFIASRIPTWHVNIPARRVESHAAGADVDAPRLIDESETLDILRVTVPVSSLLGPPEG